MNMEINTSLTEHVKCPNCNSDRYETIRESRYPENITRKELVEFYSSSSSHKLIDAIVMCNKCSLVYLNPRVNHDIICEGYENAIDYEFINQNNERINTFKKSFGEICKKYNINNTKNTFILDIGCAGGAFPKAVNDLGYNVIGIEPSKWLAEHARQLYNLDIRSGQLDEQNFEPASFDVVSLWDVIEHLTSPNDVVADIYNLLKPGGYFLVNYPDYGSLASKTLGSNWPMLLNVHLIYFTRKTIREFLESRGFVVIETSPYYQTLQLGYVLQRASSYFSIFKFILKLVNLFGLSRIPIKYNIGQTLVIAVKK
jgi:SAM-dependent methyltransferase